MKTIIAALLLSNAALAAEEVTLERVDVVRARFNIGYWGSGGTFGYGSLGLLGMQLSLGVQLNDRVAVYAMGAASTTVLLGNLYGAAIVEYGITDFLALGTGFAVATEYLNTFDGSYLRTAVGAPVRLTFSVGPTQPSEPIRGRFFIAADAFFGYRVKADTAGWRGAAFGYSPFSWMVGLGCGFQLM